MRRRANLILALASAAMACAQPVSAKDSPKDAKDPNEWICEKQTIVGSRINTRRVCATRAQWDEMRRLDKEAIDKAQTQVGVIKI